MRAPAIRRAAVAVAVAAAGCTSSTAPANVTGTWSYDAQLSGINAVLPCTVTGATLTLTESAAAVDGSYSGLTLACQPASGAFSAGPFSGALVGGTITGATLVFSFDLATCCSAADSWSNTGSVSGNSMTGSTALTFDFGGAGGLNAVSLRGTWTAHRQ